MPLRDEFDVRWLVIHSRGDQPEWYGGVERNAALDLIPVDDSLVWNLDDDNLVHPSMSTVLKLAIQSTPNAAGWLFGQRRSDGAYLPPNANAKPGQVDTAQFIFRRSAIADVRWHSGNENDAVFFADVRARVGTDKITALPMTACFHNALSL